MAYCFGSHMSIAGGLHLAAERASEVGCDCMQIFTKNNNQWNCKPISDAEASAFVSAVQKFRLKSTIAHTSYLINLASPDEALWSKSLDALVVEWRRAEQLQLAGLVVHPGAAMSQAPEQGLERVARSVAEAIRQVAPQCCRLLLENTAGQGTWLGWRFEQLGFLLSEIKSKHAGVCLDTCHSLAAGYEFRTAAGLKKMCQEFDSAIGFEHLHAIHVNDSKKGCGSRVDRHEHIGKGEIGEEAFARFLRCSSFKNIPMYLETEKGTDEESGEDWDVHNLATLRRLTKAKPRSK